MRDPASNAATNHAESFAPISRADARVLILGSMPGRRSLDEQRYYAHPQNRFWPFIGELLSFPDDLPYQSRCARLRVSGIALWDVLAQCEREGSLDSAIRDDSARPNDFNVFLAAHPAITTVLFNGAKAETSFRRLVLPSLQRDGLRQLRLPSTSPANASQPRDEKLDAWRGALSAAGITVENR